MFGHPGRCLKTLSLLLALVCINASAEQANPDPYEGFNRAMFSFNEKADKYVLKPVSKGYKFITPDPVERGIGRVFSNLGEIVTVGNDLLQGKFGQAANDTGRFLVNSTLGVAGIFDVATHVGLPKNEKEDFGQTLGVWGLGSGPYLVLPFLGPSTLRDAPARLVDGYANPINFVDHVPTRNTIYGTEVVSGRAALLDAEELISGDKYVFLRDVYLQRRSYLVSDGELEDSFGDDFDESEELDDYYE